jgi:16S rRNA (adenine1518-N6/adenine1519-N6)-dimethyltransferase
MGLKDIKNLPRTKSPLETHLKLTQNYKRRPCKDLVRGLLRRYNIYPSKRLGQNFLVDRKVFKKIIEAANFSGNDVVLEIGPGVGNLTFELAKRVKKVVAIEKDPKMVNILKELLDRWNVRNVELVKEDILKFNPETYNLKPKTYRVVANLPYYVASPVIRKFLEIENKPKELILMVQKEVAQRICACPPKLKERRRAKPLRLCQGYGGQAKMNLLAVSVQFYAKPKIISFVSKKSFWPQPKVDGAIIRIAPLINTDRKLINADLFFKIVKAGFSQPRKQLVNNLSQKLKITKEKVRDWLLKNGLQPTQRAETLSLENWIRLVKNSKIN